MTDFSSVASCTPYQTQRATNPSNIATTSAIITQQGSLKALALGVLERNTKRNDCATTHANSAQLSPSDKHLRVALVLAQIADEFDYPVSVLDHWYKDDIDALFDMRANDIRLIVHDFITGGYK